MNPVALTNVVVYFRFLTIEAATSATGEYQVLDNVVHVSAFPPVQQMNGGLTVDDYYDIEGTDPNNIRVSLPEQKFVGFSSTGVARFAAEPQDGVAILIGSGNVAKREIREA